MVPAENLQEHFRCMQEYCVGPGNGVGRCNGPCPRKRRDVHMLCKQGRKLRDVFEAIDEVASIELTWFQQFSFLGFLSQVALNVFSIYYSLFNQPSLRGQQASYLLPQKVVVYAEFIVLNIYLVMFLCQLARLIVLREFFGKQFTDNGVQLSVSKIQFL